MSDSDDGVMSLHTFAGSSRRPTWRTARFGTRGDTTQSSTTRHADSAECHQRRDSQPETLSNGQCEYQRHNETHCDNESFPRSHTTDTLGGRSKGQRGEQRQRRCSSEAEDGKDEMRPRTPPRGSTRSITKNDKGRRRRVDVPVPHDNVDDDNDAKSTFIRTLIRLQNDTEEGFDPIVPFPKEAAYYVPLPEDIKLGDGETQLRLMFGSMLTDLLVDTFNEMGLNENKDNQTHMSLDKIKSKDLPKSVPPSLLLKSPFDIKLSDFEITQIKEMRRFLKTRNVRLFGTIFEDGRYMLRYLQGNKWSPDRALDDMHKHMEWRGTSLPIRYASVSVTMPTGFIYIHGRDKAYRPIFVLRGKAMQNVPHDDILDLVYYWLEFTVGHLLYPTRVEQWSVILDLSECSFYSVPIRMLKDIAVGLQRNYMCRLSRIFVINAPYLFCGIWTALTLVLRETTTQKIKFLGNDFKDVLKERIHPDQLEARYGGNCDNVVDYHLPIMPSGRICY